METTINLTNISTVSLVRRAASGTGYEISVGVPSRIPFQKPKQTWIPFTTVDTLVNDRRMAHLGNTLFNALKPLSVPLRSAGEDFVQVANHYASFLARAGFVSEHADSTAGTVEQSKSSQVRGAFGIVFQQIGLVLGLLAGEQGLVATMPTLGAVMGSKADEARKNAMTYATLGTVALLVNTAPHLIAAGEGTAISAHGNATFKTGVGTRHDLYIELLNVRTKQTTVLPIAYETIGNGVCNTQRLPWEPNAGLPFKRLGIARYERNAAPAYVTGDAADAIEAAPAYDSVAAEASEKK